MRLVNKTMNLTSNLVKLKLETFNRMTILIPRSYQINNSRVTKITIRMINSKVIN